VQRVERKNGLEMMVRDMTNRKGYLVILLCYFFYLVGCDTVREISIEVLVPAEVTIPDHIHNVTFLNRSYPPSLGKDPADMINRTVEDLYILDSIFNNKFFLGVFDALNSSPLFELNMLSPLQIRRTDTTRFPQPLSEQELQDARDTLHTDALISLEGYRVADMEEALYTWDYYYWEDYSNDLVNKFVYLVGGTAQWRIYDLLNKTILDEFLNSDTLLWTAFAKSRESAIIELPEVVDAYREYAYQTGYDFGMRISPSWSEVRRFYFISGSKNIRKAAELADQGKWDDASVLWKEETDSENLKIAAKTRFNMALYSEMRDLIIPAIDWAKKSYEALQEKYTKTYIEILEKRKLNKLKLQEQIPIG
jgi:hypothetical protein